MKSTSGSALYFGNSLIHWSTEKQDNIALSTMESEYVAATETAKDLLFLKNLIEELTMKPIQSKLLCDNQAAIGHALKCENRRRTRHMENKATPSLASNTISKRPKIDVSHTSILRLVSFESLLPLLKLFTFELYPESVAAIIRTPALFEEFRGIISKYGRIITFNYYKSNYLRHLQTDSEFIAYEFLTHKSHKVYCLLIL